ncbi:MAG: ADP-ribosylglycohydrolase family protein [Chloroflexota bacterium]|nr:ADP-ribosylglycohydrolase family protein [Chloroflexota bacterium]MDE2684164.1 ADP-ribosylglycohydrolase family protein [Chloroflexota bacterium]
MHPTVAFAIYGKDDTSSAVVKGRYLYLPRLRPFRTCLPHLRRPNGHRSSPPLPGQFFTGRGFYHTPATNWMRGNRSKGHTIVTMQAGLWAATTPLNFEDALVALVNSGGDTDTNGALAGAVLGARYGASEIPPRWTSHVSQRERLADLAERLASL